MFGHTGSPQDVRATARHVAISQYIRRRKYASETKQVDNAKLNAETALCFYCKHCDILVDMLPHDYFFPAASSCTQCLGLQNCDWMPDAKKAYETGVIPEENVVEKVSWFS